MKHVLVPTDFSENALNALNYGRLLFDKVQVTFYLLHVYKSRVSRLSNEYGGEWLDVKTEAVKNDLRNLLQDTKKKNANSRHYFNAVSRADGFLESVDEIVRTKKIDCIIMGAKGPRGAFDTFLSGKAVALIKKISLPIIVIPKSYVLKKPSQVVFSTNFNRAFNLKELELLNFLAKTWHCKIKIVQIMRDESLNDFQKVNKDSFKDLFKGRDIYFHKITVSTSETAAIRDFAMKTEGDIISLVNHKLNFFHKLTEENVIKKVTFNSTVPILILPQLVQG